MAKGFRYGRSLNEMNEMRFISNVWWDDIYSALSPFVSDFYLNMMIREWNAIGSFHSLTINMHQRVLSFSDVVTFKLKRQIPSRFCKGDSCMYYTLPLMKRPFKSKLKCAIYSFFVHVWRAYLKAVTGPWRQTTTEREVEMEQRRLGGSFSMEFKLSQFVLRVHSHSHWAAVQFAVLPIIIIKWQSFSETKNQHLFLVPHSGWLRKKFPEIFAITIIKFKWTKVFSRQASQSQLALAGWLVRSFVSLVCWLFVCLVALCLV